MPHQFRNIQCSLSLNFSLIGSFCRSELATSVEKNRESLQSLTYNQQPTTLKNASLSAKLFFSQKKIENETSTNPYSHWVLSRYTPHTKCYTSVTFLGEITQKYTVKLNPYSHPFSRRTGLFNIKTDRNKFPFFSRRAMLKKTLISQGKTTYEFSDAVRVKTLGDAPTSNGTSADGA